MYIRGWPEGWPAPNYVDPVTRGAPSLFIAVSVITAVVVVLRLYSRVFVTRSAGADDAFIVAGFILSIGQTISMYEAMTTYGWNKHMWDVPVLATPKVRLAAWLVSFFFLLGTGCTKISVLLVYRRITSGSHSRWFVRLIWAAITFTALYVLAFTLELLLACRPLNAYWQSYSPRYTGEFTCDDEHVPDVLSAILSTISDFYASVLPMLLVRKIRLSPRQRFSLCVLFSFGLLTAGTGIGRTYYLFEATTNYKPGPHTHDSTWLGWPLFAFTAIESNLAIICACAPALKVLFIQRLREPFSRAYNASRLARTNPRTRPSSRGIVQRSHSGAGTTPLAQKIPARATTRNVSSLPGSNVPPSSKADRDVETTIALGNINEKPLPPSPLVSPNHLYWARSRTRRHDDDSVSDFLPIHYDDASTRGYRQVNE